MKYPRSEFYISKEKLLTASKFNFHKSVSDFNICSFIVDLCSRHFCATDSKFRNSNKKVRSVLPLIKVNWTESFNCVRNQLGGT